MRCGVLERLGRLVEVTGHGWMDEPLKTKRLRRQSSAAQPGPSAARHLGTRGAACRARPRAASHSTTPSPARQERVASQHAQAAAVQGQPDSVLLPRVSPDHRPAGRMRLLPHAAAAWLLSQQQPAPRRAASSHIKVALPQAKALVSHGIWILRPQRGQLQHRLVLRPAERGRGPSARPALRRAEQRTRHDTRPQRLQLSRRRCVDARQQQQQRCVPAAWCGQPHTGSQ